MNFLLSVNTGFAVNRITETEELMKFASQDLEIQHLQVTSDILDLYMDKGYLNKKIKKFNKLRKIYDIKINSTFTGAFSRLHHLGHPDTEVQKFWIKWFKNFIQFSSNIGATQCGSHLGILTYKEDRNKRIRSEKLSRIIDNWHKVSIYANKAGLTNLVWEPMSISREFGETIKQCKSINDKLNKNTDIPFKICLDLGHGDLESKNKDDYNPYKWIKKLSKYSSILHLKQVIKNNFAHLPFTKQNNVKGIIDGAKVIDLLKENTVGVNSYELSLELSFKERNPIDYKLKNDVKDSVNYWKKIIK